MLMGSLIFRHLRAGRGRILYFNIIELLKYKILTPFFHAGHRVPHLTALEIHSLPVGAVVL